jgi:hypothetical protein
MRAKNLLNELYKGAPCTREFEFTWKIPSMYEGSLSNNDGMCSRKPIVTILMVISS